MAEVAIVSQAEILYSVAGRRIQQAFDLLRVGFTLLPIAAGADKFFHWLANWEMYLAPPLASLLPVSAHQFMLVVGVAEIAAGICVAVTPRIGGLVVGSWLLAVAANLLLFPGFYDIALRDLGLAAAAFSLWRLGQVTQGTPLGGTRELLHELNRKIA